MTGETASVHGCAAILGTAGVFVRGPSASGKSRLTDALIEATIRRRNFARWVADDRILFRSVNGKLIAGAPEMIAGQIEHHHFGVRSVDFISSAVVDLVIELTPADQLERLPDESTTIIDDIELPLVLVPQKELCVSVPLVLATLNKLAEEDNQTGY